MRSGALLVEVESHKQAQNLMKMDKIIDTPVEVSPHRSLNQCRGIIKSAELDHVSEDELLSEIRNQHATNVKRIYVTRDGMKKPTNTWEVTFATPSAPSRLKAGYLSLAVFPYIPNPLRCFKCQLFGHHQGFCSRDPVCSKCGLKDHEDKNCTQTLSCVNCKGAHPECPKWIEEREICRVKATTNVSFKEARKFVLDKKNTPTEGKSHAAAAGTSQHCCTCKCSSTQPNIATSDTTKKATSVASAPASKSIDIKKNKLNDQQSNTTKSSSQQQPSNVSKQATKNANTKSQADKTSTGIKSPKPPKPNKSSKEQSAHTPRDKISVPTKNRFSSLEERIHMEICVPDEFNSCLSDS